MNRRFFALVLAAISIAAIDLHAQNQTETVVQETEDGKVVTTTTVDKHKVETNYFSDNIFITFGIGTQFYMGENEKHMKFKDLLTPALDLSVGKWFTPGLGLAMSYSGYKFKGVWCERYTGQNFKTDKVYPNPVNGYNSKEYNLYEQKADFFNLHIDALVNLSNLFYGYKKNRIYNFIPYIGVGWMQSYNTEERNAGNITLNAGIINRFRLSDALDLNITVRGALIDDSFDGEISGAPYRGLANLKPENYKEGAQNHGLEGYGGITVGLTYKFRTRFWKKARSVETVYSCQKEIVRLNDELNALRSQNEELKSNTAPAYIRKEIIVFPYLVNFVIDKVEVVNHEKVNLKSISEMIKSTPEKKYLICGYADKFTGSAKRNQWLAEHRAKNVHKVLTEEFGVSPEQLVIDYKGGVDNLQYNDPQVSRSAVISEIKQ